MVRPKSAGPVHKKPVHHTIEAMSPKFVSDKPHEELVEQPAETKDKLIEQVNSY